VEATEIVRPLKVGGGGNKKAMKKRRGTMSPQYRSTHHPGWEPLMDTTKSGIRQGLDLQKKKGETDLSMAGGCELNSVVRVTRCREDHWICKKTVHAEMGGKKLQKKKNREVFCAKKKGKERGNLQGK